MIYNILITLGDSDENLGQKFIDSLIEKDVVKIQQVNQEEAQDGLVNEKYFVVITIPRKARSINFINTSVSIIRRNIPNRVN